MKTVVYVVCSMFKCFYAKIFVLTFKLNIHNLYFYLWESLCLTIFLIIALKKVFDALTLGFWIDLDV